MSEYDDAVLADNPLLYLRGDEEEGATEFADHSGNGYDFPLLADVVLAALIGPVETDTPNLAARADPTPIGGFGFFGMARYPDPVPSAIDPRDELSYECWAYCLAGRYNQALIRSGNVPNLSGNVVGLAGTTAVFKLTFPSGAFQISKTGLAAGAWYHLVMTRSGAVMRLYVNRVLVGERTDLPPGETVSVGVESGWKLGPQFGTDACPGASRWAVYDHVLTQARVTAHYNAAKLTTALSGIARGTSTARLDSYVAPEPKAFAFRHNWREPVVETLARRTAVAQSRSGREQRAGLRSKPRREIEYVVTTESEGMRRRLAAFLFANQRKIVTVPFHPDRARLSAPVSASETVLAVETEFMDYDEGSRVMLADFATGKAEAAVVDLVEANQLTLRAGLKYGWPERTPVMPARRALLEERINLAAKSARVEEVRLLARVLVEDTPSSTNRFTAWAPTYTYKTIEGESLEVFDPFTWGRHDSSEPRQVTSDQQRDSQDEEIGVFAADSGTDAPQGSSTHRLVLQGRERIAGFLGWWDARSGSRVPLWVPSFDHDFEVVSISASQVTVTDSNYVESYNRHGARRDLAFISRSRTMAFRRITAAATAGADEVLTVNASASSLASSLRQLSFLKLCRLDADALELAWLTHDKVRVTVRFRELLTSPA